MKNIILLVLLFLGLSSFSQTNTHQRISGRIYTRGLNFFPSNNDLQIILYEVDTLGNARPSILSNYMVSQQGNQYAIDFILPPTNRVIVYAKVLPGSRLQGKFLSTFGLSSLSTTNAAKVTVPYTPPGTITLINYDIYMIPDIFWRANSRHTD